METKEVTQEFTFMDNLADWELRDRNKTHYLSLSGFMHRWQHCSGMRASAKIPYYAVQAMWRDGVANPDIREIGWCSCACKKKKVR